MIPEQKRRAVALLCGVGGVVLLAFALRAIGFERVFPDDETVVLSLADANYHARRALWTLHNFPRFLTFDPYLNYPDGASVPWPPLLDWLVAAVSLLLGGSLAAFERVAAWTPPLLGAATVVPVYLLGRRARGPALGIGAAVIFACLPQAVRYAQVGNFDHHPAQVLAGAVLLLLYARALDPRTRGRDLLRTFGGLVLARSALMLVWQGSLLYLGPGEVALMLYAGVSRRHDLLAAQALSAVATLALIAPFVAASGNLIGGPYSAVELSRLHLVAYGAISLVAVGVLVLERIRPARSAAAGLARALGLGLGLGALLLAFPGVREGLPPALEFLTRADEYGGRNLENQPLFYGLGAAARSRATAQLGYFAYLVPLAPLALLWAAWRRTDERGPLLLLAFWAALSGLLGMSQTRYLHDFAPVGSTAFALLLADAGDRIRARAPGPAWLPNLAVVLAGALLLGPALRGHATGASRSLAARSAAPGHDRALDSAQGTLLRFAQAVRDATPATAGLFDAGAVPEYSVLGFIGIGHALHYTGERATPADNFGPYIGRDNYLEVTNFFTLRSEAEAFETARRLGARYVVTMFPVKAARGTVLHKLHLEDGSDRRGQPAFQHFRLVTEGPKGGVPLSVLFGGRPTPGAVPYKLFERVEGAELVVKAEPGAKVTARVEVETPTERRFYWIAVAKADAEGVARLRVPYATVTELPARPLGPYRVSGSGRVFEVDLSEDDVLEGREVRVPRDQST